MSQSSLPHRARPCAERPSAHRLTLALSLLLGCASAPRPAPSAGDPLAALRASPVAREVARAAPEAFAAFAQDLQRAEAAPPELRESAIEDATATLIWGHARARAAIARERTEAAAARTAAAEEALRRAEQQAQAIDEELDRAAAAQGAQARAAAAARAPVSSPARTAAAADLRQQAALLLAAARLLGASDALCAATQAAIDAAEAGARAANAGALAGRAFQSAEALVERARREATVSNGETRVNDTALLRSVAATPELDPHLDARGVIAVMRGLFAGVALAPTARSRITPVANILRAHGTMRARVEVFAGGPPAAARARARQQAEALRAGLIAQGVEAARIEAQGVVRVPGGARSDDRAEVALIAP